MGDGVEINPVGAPQHWPETQTVLTPFGPLKVDLEVTDGRATLSFSCEERFPVTVRFGGVAVATTSQGACRLDE